MNAVAARIGSGGWKEFQVADIVPVPCRTTAHDHKQLAEALGWTVVQVDKAIQLGGILPRYELKTPRRKGATVDELVARREEQASALDEAALLSVGEMIAALGMQGAEWSQGREHGIIPGPDCGLFWSRALASDLAARSEDLRAQIPPQPLGANNCTGMLRDLTGLDVTRDDFLDPANGGHVDCVDYYKDWPLFDVAAVQRLGTTEDGKAAVASVVAARVAWMENSVTTEDAARWLERDARDFERTAAAQGIKAGRFRRRRAGPRCPRGNRRRD
jgi:hypothetical protein